MSFILIKEKNEGNMPFILMKEKNEGNMPFIFIKEKNEGKYNRGRNRKKREKIIIYSNHLYHLYHL